MQKVLIALCLLAVTCWAMPLNHEELRSLWSSWKINYGKAYGLAEEAARFAIFVENYKRIVQFNAENDKVKQGLNKFADLTGEEFKNLHSSCYINEDRVLQTPENTIKFDDSNVADAVDWRTKGAVTPVKDQGQCGSCWSFSATGTLEGFYFLNNGKLLSFSEQQIVDCDTGSYGCGGGWMYQALEYTGQNGVETEDEYPYKAKDGSCQFNTGEAVKTNTGYKFVTPNDADALRAAVAALPVSVAIEADQASFQFYTGGVLQSGCGASLDHGVLVVGFTTVNGVDAWIVKNSWGTSWGDQGYIYISADPNANNGAGVCGILSQPSVPN